MKHFLRLVLALACFWATPVQAQSAKSVSALVTEFAAAPCFKNNTAGENTWPGMNLCFGDLFLSYPNKVTDGTANTMVGNWTNVAGSMLSNAMPSCPDSGGNHLNYVTGTGITCGTGLGNGITALTGDVTATGPGSVAATLATAQPGAHTWALDQSFTGVAFHSAGTAANPSIASTGDTNTGFWQNGTGIWEFSSAGASRIRLRASQVQVGSGVTYCWASGAAAGTCDTFLNRTAAAGVQLGATTGAGAAVAQTLSVQGSSGNSAAAALFTIAGSDQAGTTTTGGGVQIRGGNGTSAGGAVEIWTSATTTPAVAASWAANKNATFAGTLTLPAGAVGAPSANYGDPTTGHYKFGTNQIGVATAGFIGTGFDNAVGFRIASNYLQCWSGTGGNPFTACDLTLRRKGAANLGLGAGAAASPVAQLLSGQDSRAGTDSDVGGGNVTITSGVGTGTGTLASLILQSPVAVASGTGAQTLTTGLTIKNGTFISVGYTVATLPATHVAGARAHVTDQLTTCAVPGAAVTGGGALVCPVFDNGVAWVGG